MTVGASGWPRAALLLLCGILAGTQIGKLPSAIPDLRENNPDTLAGLPCTAAVESGIGWHAVAPLLITACVAYPVCGVAGARDAGLRTARAAG